MKKIANQTTSPPVIQIRSERVISSTLRVDGAQIQCVLFRQHPQLFRNAVGKRRLVVHLFALSAQETAKKRIDASFLDDPIGREERQAGWQVTL